MKIGVCPNCFKYTFQSSGCEYCDWCGGLHRVVMIGTTETLPVQFISNLLRRAAPITTPSFVLPIIRDPYISCVVSKSPMKGIMYVLVESEINYCWCVPEQFVRV